MMAAAASAAPASSLRMGSPAIVLMGNTPRFPARRNAAVERHTRKRSLDRRV
jgi:hypothetical protein